MSLCQTEAASHAPIPRQNRAPFPMRPRSHRSRLDSAFARAASDCSCLADHLPLSQIACQLPIDRHAGVDYAIVHRRRHCLPLTVRIAALQVIAGILEFGDRVERVCVARIYREV